MASLTAHAPASDAEMELVRRLREEDWSDKDFATLAAPACITLRDSASNYVRSLNTQARTGA